MTVAINWNCEEDKIILEDAVVKLEKENPLSSDFLGKNFSQVEKLILVSDDMFKYSVENCTEVQTQIKIDEKTGTAKSGALRYSEYLPSDTLMYSVVMFNDDYFDNELQANTVKEKIKSSIKSFVQIGGDQTLGRGIFKVNWIGENNG
ncbi:MAG: RAMP superfamily CRISPR-associated protein, partial [Acidobacteriota bacterium]|nr:RAMP superfamily CRISPR-associated protein [Acidobacteriota bacterium]